MERAGVSKTILSVDDDVAILLALKKRLTAAGLEVVTATNGADALAHARDCHVDAMTLDVNMPGEMDGLNVASALSRDPRTACIPIVFVTGAADAGFKQRCVEAGGKYFLSKPYDVDLLLQLLNNIFARDELAEVRTLSQAKRRQPVARS